MDEGAETEKDSHCPTNDAQVEGSDPNKNTTPNIDLGSDTETDESMNDGEPKRAKLSNGVTEVVEESRHTAPIAPELIISNDDGDVVVEESPENNIPLTRRQQRLSVKYIHKEFQSRQRSASRDSVKELISPQGVKRNSPEQESPNLQQPDLNSMLLPDGQGQSRKYHRARADDTDTEGDTPVPRRLALRKAAIASAASQQAQQLTQISTLVQTTEDSKGDSGVSPPFQTYVGQGPPSAYSLFVQSNLKKRKKTDVTTLAQEWARTSPRQRKTWQEQADQLNQQNAKSAAEPEEKTSSKRKRKQKSQNQSSNNSMEPPPKRPMGSFVLFLEANLAKWKKDHPDRPHKEVVAMIGHHWSNELSLDDKQHYVDLAAANRKEYERLKILHARGAPAARSSIPYKGDSLRPRGRAPKGKVWDKARGCWMDAVESSETSAQTENAVISSHSQNKKRKISPKVTSRPRGRAPNGKVWDESMNSWVDERKSSSQNDKVESSDSQTSLKPGVAKVKSGLAKAKKPRGRAPIGKMWDENLGKWVPERTGFEGIQSVETNKVGDLSFKGDVEPSIGASTSTKKKPRGRAPQGKTWDSTHGKWVPDINTETPVQGEEATKDQTKASATGSISMQSTKRPRGRAPKGRVWDDQRNSWVGLDSRSPVKQSVKRRPKGRAPAGKLWDESKGSWVPLPSSIKLISHGTSISYEADNTSDGSSEGYNSEGGSHKIGNPIATATTVHKQIMPTSSRRRPQRRREEKTGRQDKNAPTSTSCANKNSSPAVATKEGEGSSSKTIMPASSGSAKEKSRPKTKAAPKPPPKTPEGMQWDAASGVWKPLRAPSIVIPEDDWTKLAYYNQNAWADASLSGKYLFSTARCYGKPKASHNDNSSDPAAEQKAASLAKENPQSNFEKIALKTGRVGEDGSIYPQLHTPLIRLPDKTFQRPLGKPPTGYTWDGVRAVWIPDTFETFVACGSCPNCLFTKSCGKCLSCRNRSGTCCLRVCIKPIRTEH